MIPSRADIYGETEVDDTREPRGSNSRKNTIAPIKISARVMQYLLEE